MDQHELTFVIPTYRLRDVAETVEQYDQHFWRNGHSLRIVDSPELLRVDEVSHGRLHKAGKGQAVHKSFDIVAAFKDVLAKPVSDIPENYEQGELLVDTAMDLETNATKGLSTENSLMLQRGPVDENAIVKIAQTLRAG